MSDPSPRAELRVRFSTHERRKGHPCLGQRVHVETQRSVGSPSWVPFCASSLPQFFYVPFPQNIRYSWFRNGTCGNYFPSSCLYPSRKNTDADSEKNNYSKSAEFSVFAIIF